MIRAALVVVTCTLACRTERMPSELITRAELAPAEASLAAHLAAPYPCERAVLRHRPLPGAAADAQRAALAAAETGGEALVAAVRTAVAHTSACSAFAYAPGAPHASDQHWYALARELAAHVTRLARTDAIASLQLAIDGVRLFQDLRRGRVEGSTLVLALSGQRTLLDAVIAAPWSAANPPGAQAEIQALIASEPALDETLHALLDVIAQSPVIEAPDVETTAMRQTLRAADLMAIHQLRAQVDAACPRGTSLRACADKLAALATPATVLDPADLSRPFTDETRAAIRDRVVAALRTSHAQTLAAQVRDLAEPVAMLTVLSIRLRTEQAGCPASTEVLRESPWADLRAPAPLGAPIPVTRVAGALLAKLPDWIARGSGGLRAWTIPCPSQRAP